MRFRRLEVRAYRAIQHAVVEFGPGLNVLHGPNDLGKSTLASALRAVLLLPADSTAHQPFVSWDGGEPPRVSLTFESPDGVFRVSKTFGSSSSALAVLESSRDGVTFREEARFRAVDRRLRELLGWGIEAPGGKGGTRGLPESFLSQVLMGAQDGVTELLERSLSGDRDASGRERLHDALQALAQDPLFKQVLEAAQAKVEIAYTPTGRKRTGQQSPFFAVCERINGLSLDVERFEKQRRESEEVLLRIRTSTALGSEARAEREQIERRLLAERAARARYELRAAAEQRLERASRSVAELQAAASDLRGLEQALSSAGERERKRSESLQAADAALAKAEAELAAAESALSARSREPLGSGAAARAPLSAELSALQARLASDRALLELEQVVQARQASWAIEQQAVAAASVAERRLSERVSVAQRALEAIRRLEHMAHLREAEAAAARADQTRREGAELERRAEIARQKAAEPAELGLPSQITAEGVEALRRLEAEMRLAEARLEVGLSVTLSAPKGTHVALSIDGAESAARLAEPRQFVAKSRIDLELPGNITIGARAGDASLREGLALLERRWETEAKPWLALAGVASLSALSERLERERAERREREVAAREAAALTTSAAEKSALGAELSLWQGRVEERRRALCAEGGAITGAEAAELAALGAGWESALRTRSVTAEGELATARQALDAQVAVELRLAARSASLGESLLEAEGARDRLLGQTRAALDPGAIAAPKSEELLAEFGRRVTDGEARIERITQQIAALELKEKQEAEAVAERQRRALSTREAARSAQLAARADQDGARESRLSLEVQLAERRRQLQSLDVRAAEEELSSARAEIERIGEAPEMTAEGLRKSEAELGLVEARIAQISAELSRAEGALGQVGGDVVVERERQAREALERARELELELEQDYAAYQLLTQTLRAVENEQGVHLGRALEGPVSERFERLTAGRYPSVGLDRELGLTGVMAAGQPRGFKDLSMGTREQLATILRLCVAEQTGSALVLDDHLAQTHRQRIVWFRRTLEQAADRIQVIVLTARPEDYLDPELVAASRDTVVAASGTRVVDLEQVIRRS